MAKRKLSWFKKTEKLLYDYKTYDLAIRNLEAELKTIMPQVSCSLIIVGQVGHKNTRTPFESQTEEWAIKRAESPRAKRLLALLQEKWRWRKTIKEIRVGLTEEENTFICLRYERWKAHDEVREILEEQGFPRSRRSYFRMRRRVIKKIAKFIGLFLH